MRLWSLCPRLLDGKGLGGCWVEALLCQSVLAGRTTVYRNHPQVARWRETPSPLAALGAYLAALQQEATRRGFNYNASLILEPPQPLAPAPPALEVTTEQLQYEIQHLLGKLQQRDPDHCAHVQQVLAVASDMSAVPAHPCFVVMPGPVAEWERVKAEEKVKAKSAIRDTGMEEAAAAVLTERITTRSSSRSSSNGARTIPITSGDGEEAHGSEQLQQQRVRRRLRSWSGGSSEAEAEDAAAVVGKKRTRPAAAATTTTAAAALTAAVEDDEQQQLPQQQATPRRSSRVRQIEIK